jgi:arginine decarboxylase-like protein
MRNRLLLLTVGLLVTALFSIDPAAQSGATTTWPEPAHALVALARVNAVDALKLLPSFLTHSIWQVRMYAAHAAGRAGMFEGVVKLGADLSRREVGDGVKTDWSRSRFRIASIQAIFWSI